MYRTVESTVDAYSGSWSGLPAFANPYNVFKEKLIQLQNYGKEQSSALIGVSVAKEAQRVKTADKTVKLASALSAYAASIDNEILREQVNVSSTEVLHASRASALQVVERILELATTHLANLGDFGISQSDVEDLEAAHDELNLLFYAPRKAIVDRKYLTDAMDELVNDLDDLLKNTIDKLMVVIKDSDEVFYHKYISARTIVHFGTGHSTGSDPGEGGTPPASGETNQPEEE